MRMHCMQMALCTDGAACGWHCMRMGCMGMWMVVAVEMVGTDECKEKTKNKYLLDPDEHELADALHVDVDRTGCG